MKTKSPNVSQMKLKQRAKSAKLGQAKFQRGFFKNHQDLLVFDEGKKYDYTQQDPNGATCLRRQSPSKDGGGQYNDG